MDYETACSAIVTREEARREIEQGHGLTFEEFAADCGDRPTYRGRTVLDWLGY